MRPTIRQVAAQDERQCDDYDHSDDQWDVNPPGIRCRGDDDVFIMMMIIIRPTPMIMMMIREAFRYLGPNALRRTAFNTTR